MDTDDLFPFVAIAAIVALGLAAKALFDAHRATARLAALTERFVLLDGGLQQLAAQIRAAPAPETPPAPTSIPEAEIIAGDAPPETPPPVEEPAPPLPTPEAPPPVPVRGWEQKLVEHWLVWLGGVTLALGGAFLVKASIDYGLLVPGVRVVLGIAFGIGLSIAGEWISRGEPTDPQAEAQAGHGAFHVPQALVAAGAAIVFASLYAAYALYGLIPAGLAFMLLAATAIVTVAQSLRHGPLVAALGLVGAYVVPLLVASDAPRALPLFAYLAVVTAASLAVLRHRAWWWLAWLSLAGSIGWALLWLATAADPETLVVACYLLLQLGLFAAFRFGVDRIGFLAGTATTQVVRVLTRCAAWAIAVALFALAHADGFGNTGIAAALLAMAGLMAIAYRDRELDDVIAAAGALALALLVSWQLPWPHPDMDYWVFRVEPDHIAAFSTACVAFTLLLGGGGFALLPRVPRPGRWAALSAAVPPLVLIIAYWRLQRFDVDFAWSLAALALAGIELGAAGSVARRRDGSPENEIALAAYAVGVLAGTIIAATLALSEAWLTVALALHLPAIGWVERRARVPALRWLALGIAVAAIVRLVLNPYVLEYPLGPTPIVNWLLYGYGVPAASFIVATRVFGDSKDDTLVWVLEAGSASFLLALLTLELIHLIYGQLVSPFPDFAPGAAVFSLWLAFAAGMLALGERRQRPVLRWGGSLLFAATITVGIVWQAVMVLFGAEVGDLVGVDALLLADALPAVLCALIAWLCPLRPALRVAARILAAAFGFAWVTLEIDHFFNGDVELFHRSSEAEWYAYSLAWLIFAVAVLAMGLLRRNQWLRRAGLLGIALVVAKVFLSDMAELSGLLRALSFMGLGGALVALGYAYRRLRPLPAAA
jgi:uncharacterized membrane protein